MIQLNAITNPRPVNWLIRTFGMKIAGSPAPTLAPEVAPSIDVNQQDDPTLYYLRGTRLLAASRFEAAVAAQYAWFQIENAASSGVIVVITRVMHSFTTNFRHGARLTASSPLATVSQVTPRDGRWTASFRAAATFSSTTSVTPQVIPQYLMTTSVQSQDCAIVIPPGQSWGATVDAVNVQGWCAVEFYERPIMAEELSTG